MDRDGGREEGGVQTAQCGESYVEGDVLWYIHVERKGGTEGVGGKGERERRW